MRLKFLKLAKQDIGEAVSHFKRTAPHAIDGFAAAIKTSLSLILSNPNVGRPSQTANIREWSVPNWPYVIPYRIVGDDIEILRVWHTRRDRPEAW
jgi:toxin ParE1/3/4